MGVGGTTFSMFATGDDFLNSDNAPATLSPKARQILDGAREAFLELGYEGASTDDIVRRAGVSKGTVYKYFPDKRTLFVTFVQEECEAQAQRALQIEGSPRDPEPTLRRMARNMVALLVSPSIHAIYRLAVGESERFPELAQTFFRSGPGLGIRRIADFLQAAVAEGSLAIDDVELAADQFNQLCKADLFYRYQFQIRRCFSQADIHYVADAAVDTFLRAYRA